MPDIKEKLVELMELNIDYGLADILADRLIANGVTIQEWISVEERLPERERENYSEYLVVVVRSHWPTSSYDPVDAPYDEEYTTVAMYDSEQKLWHLGRSEVVLNALLPADDAPLNGEHVTHWMPLPEPPEGGADG